MTPAYLCARCGTAADPTNSNLVAGGQFLHRNCPPPEAARVLTRWAPTTTPNYGALCMSVGRWPSPPPARPVRYHELGVGRGLRRLLGGHR